MASNAPEPVDEPFFVPEVVLVSPEEGRRMFDEAARRIAGMSGAEFIRRYDAGEYAGIADDAGHREIIELAMLVNVGRSGAPGGDRIATRSYAPHRLVRV